MWKNTTDKRQLNNGITLHREPSPLKRKGYIYYVDGGPEGWIQVWDSYLVNDAIISACLAWDLDEPNYKTYKTTLKMEFNNNV